MNLTDEQIKEIAELLECGMVCYVHKQTLSIEYFPDYNELYLDPEEWQDTMNKVKNATDDYICISKMDSKQAFQTMEDFALTVSDEPLKNHLQESLTNKKPFQNFRAIVINSDFKNNWHAYKTSMYINYVKSQL